MKVKQKKNAKPLLSDRIADALTLKPRADIEDDQVFGTKPKTISRADLGSSDSEDEAAISDFRKRNVNLLSEVSKKYSGQVVARKYLEKSDSELTEESSDAEHVSTTNRKLQPAQDSSDSENDTLLSSKIKVGSDSEYLESDEDGESDDYSITKLHKIIHAQSDDDESGGGDDDNVDEDGDSNEGEGYDISQLESPLKEDFEHVKKLNISEDAKKGICVRSQLLVWESLLEMRIHLQRCMNTANQMPMPDYFAELKQDHEFVEESNATKANVANVLDKLLTLQTLLFKNFPETKSLVTKKGDKQADIKQDTKPDSDEEIPSDTDNEEIPSDTEPEDNDEKEPSLNAGKNNTTVKNNAQVKKRKLEDYESEISTSHKSFKVFRDTSIQKWNEKTRLSTAANIKNVPSNTILQQISYILSDREKLVKRTQLKRSEYDIIGYTKPIVEEENTDQNGMEVNPVMRNRKDNDEYISEIFDDSDFYHQLLRELIECKSADISDPVQLSRQWIALQQMRSKMKRKVDTKATKGRKIKYAVHNQLVNYMAPEKCNTWTDESANELYSSLFGKMFEHNNTGLNGNVGNLLKLN